MNKVLDTKQKSTDYWVELFLEIKKSDESLDTLIEKSVFIGEEEDIKAIEEARAYIIKARMSINQTMVIAKSRLAYIRGFSKIYAGGSDIHDPKNKATEPV